MTFHSYSSIVFACLLLFFSGLLLSLVKKHWAEVVSRGLVWAGVVGVVGLFSGLLALFLAATVRGC